jgi:Tfp pilus assembly protein PilF
LRRLLRPVALLFVLISLALPALPICAEAAAPLVVLVFPPELEAGVSPESWAAADSAFAAAARKAGFVAFSFRPDSAIFRRALQEDRLTGLDLAAAPKGDSGRWVALVAGAQLLLSGRVGRQEEGLGFTGQVRNGLSGKEVEVSVSAPGPGSDQSLGEELGAALAGALTPELAAGLGVTPEDLRAAAESLFKSGQGFEQGLLFREASLEFEAAMTADPIRAEYPRAAAKAWQRRGNPKRAAALLRRALALEPRDFQARLELGELLLYLKDGPGAEEQFRRAAALEPERFEPQEGLGRAYREQGRAGLAERTYRAYLEKHADSWQAEAGLGRLLAEQRRFPEAISHLRAAVAAGKDAPSSPAREELVRALFAAGQLGEAIEQALVYFEGGGALPAESYPELARLLDEEFQAISREMAAALENWENGRLSRTETYQEMEGLQERAGRLLRLAEKAPAPQEMDSAHRYRVFACALLSEAAFEARSYVDLEERDHRRRWDLLRDAAGKARLAAVGKASEAASATRPAG